MNKVNEQGFESYICDWLLSPGGYDTVKVGTAQGSQPDFDPVLALDTGELFTFIGATQIDAWNQLLISYGGDPDKAQKGFANRLAKELDARGTVDVLRHGVVDLGVTIRLAFFRPASGLTPALLERYGKNRLTVTRQLPYAAGSTKTVDLCLFVNGIPVATAELKNPLTGQGIDEAIAQYRSDRDPANPLLRRAIVHFAVDPERVAMTTRLAGKSTRFLPFNRGYELGAGNPPNPNGHRTAYLWQRVWQRDAWLDLLNHFIHVEPTPKGSKQPASVIFPRFHQWDAVRALTHAARDHGAGQDYLVQHSAGSGKSNTLAWLAHRLSSLHDAADTKVFDKVVVITDRKILDKQLQDTIYQFEHAHGVVVRIDEDSQQLARALAGEQARIVITTLQKFPFVTQHIDALPSRRYAVIVDEAHSSQTGDSATALKGVLGSKPSAPHPEEPADPAEDALAAAVAARGKQPNLSFFAFTATPKARTLELFGPLRPGHRPARAVPPVFDAPGHRGGLHPRRARQLRHVQDVLADRAGHPGRSRLRPRQGQDGHRPLRLAASAPAGPEGGGDRRTLPGQGGAEDRRYGESDGRHRLARARRALQAGTGQAHQRQGLHRRRRPGRLLRQARAGRRRRHGVVDERLPRLTDRRRVRHRAVAAAGRRGEVSDGLRSAQALRDVCR